MSNNLSFKDVFIKGAIIFNPVLVQLVGLCPVVAASTTLKSAAMLSAVACAELIVVCVTASALLKKLPRWVRVPLYLVIGLVLLCPVLWYIETKTLINLSLGMKIYIPLIAINSVVAVHCEQFAVKNSVKLAFYDAAAVGLGASVIFIAVGAIREILGSSSIGGIPLNLPIAFKGMALPFGCLIILGFMAAGLKTFVSKRYPEYLEVSAPVARKKAPEAEAPAEEPEIPVAEEIKETEIPQIKPAVPEEETAEDVRFKTEAEIDEFFKSLGIDLGEKGDEQ